MQAGRATSAGSPCQGTAVALADRLSEPELEVQQGLCSGLANKIIARDLRLSEATVKLHVKTPYRKLGVANRTQAALMARESGPF